MKWIKPKTIYMDFAAATPVSKKVAKAMQPFYSSDFYNASALYPEARKIKSVIEQARKDVAHVLHARSDEIVFTSGGTESINLALEGAIKKAKENGIEKPQVITSKLEHSAVLETLLNLEKKGDIEIIYIDCNEEGIIDSEEIKKVLTKNTVLVTIAYVQGEIGAVQDIARIGKVIQEYKKEHGSIYPLFHTDACQAPNYLQLNRDHLLVDLLSLDGAKIYGPKGVGILYIRKPEYITSHMHGGGQEKGLRPGTEPVALIVGFAEALKETEKLRSKEVVRLMKLQKYFIHEFTRLFPEAEIIGPRENRIPNNLYFCFSGSNSEFLTIALGEKGIAVSPTSACNTLDVEPVSATMVALGRSDCASSSIRFSMGRTTTKKEIDIVLKTLHKMVY